MVSTSRKLKAVFFDMDDTVLEPLSYNPWAKFKELNQLPPDQLILDGIASKPPQERTILVEKLIAYELELSTASSLRVGISEVLRQLRQQRFFTALLTNNHRAATETVLQKHALEFSLVLTREEALPKPSPDLLIKALEFFGLEAGEVAYVGDSSNDLLACQQIGMSVYFLATPHNPEFSPRFEYPGELLEALLARG